jgi:competence protein ComEC
MKKIYYLFFALFLLVLNIICWNEVFILAESRNLSVNFLNVGQGDSAFVITPGGHQILIDGGPDQSALREISSLMPFFDKTIDLVILSHPEKDHMQGLIDILQRYKADYILWTGVKKQDPEYYAWINVLEKQKNMGAKIIIAQFGQKIIAGNVFIDTLHPFEILENKELKDTSNDAGVISRLVFGKNYFLFTGDMSSNLEKEFVREDINLDSNVLKIAHHGSKYSTSEKFLQAVNPEIAVIEVGKNSYGHPTPEVLQKLEKFGIKILRTDKDGTIKIESDGNNIKVK